MKRYILLGVLAVSLLATAKTLSPEQALSRASVATDAYRVTVKEDLKLVYTAEYSNSPCAYVFQSSERGFVVTAADDVAPAVLGYSDKGEFVLNDNVSYWLEEYGRQIEWANRFGAQPRRVDGANRQSIAPWLASKWNQDAPFNLQCPTYNGNICVTGCVATAVAQVMNYYKWPVKGEGSNSYRASTINQIVSFNFGATTFDWSNMLDTYPNSGNDATETQRTAVATLMKACGVACNMDYSPWGSGTLSRDAGIGLIKYFNYDHGLEYRERQYYSPTEWEEMVYEQVYAGPLYYSGANNEAGHAFVIDGYSSDGYFHLNWGWGGVSDGYFLLTALDPDSQGIGGSSAGYNFGQEILCNVKPAGATPSEFAYNVVTGGYDFTISTTSCKRGDRVQITTPAYNNSMGTMSKMCVGLLFTSSTGGERFVLGVMGEDVEPFYGFNETEAYIPSDLAAGTYKVTYAWTTDDGVVRSVLVPYALRKSYTATVTGNSVTFTPDDFIDVTLTDVEFSPLFVDQMYKVTAEATNSNDSEFSDVVYGFLVKDNQVVYMGDCARLDVPANSTIDFTYIDTFDGVNAGAYDFWLATIHEGYLHGLIWSPVEVKTENQQPSIKFGQLQLLNDNENAVPCNDIRLQATVTNAGGYFAGSVGAWLYVYDDEGNLIAWQWVSSQPLFIENGQTVTAKFLGSIVNAYTGATCRAQIYYNEQWINTEIWFTLYDPDAPTPPVRPVVSVGPLVVCDGENLVDPADFTASTSISVTNADYTCQAYLAIKTQMFSNVYTFAPIEVNIGADETVDINFAADLSSILKANSTYNAQLYINGNAAGDKVKFKTKSSSGIIDETDETPAGGTYYNLQGIPVSTPSSGTYIFVTPNGTSKVLIR